MLLYPFYYLCVRVVYFAGYRTNTNAGREELKEKYREKKSCVSRGMKSRKWRRKIKRRTTSLYGWFYLILFTGFKIK